MRLCLIVQNCDNLCFLERMKWNKKKILFHIDSRESIIEFANNAWKQVCGVFLYGFKCQTRLTWSMISENDGVFRSFTSWAEKCGPHKCTDHQFQMYQVTHLGHLHHSCHFLEVLEALVDLVDLLYLPATTSELSIAHSQPSTGHCQQSIGHYQLPTGHYQLFYQEISILSNQHINIIQPAFQVLDHCLQLLVFCLKFSLCNLENGKCWYLLLCANMLPKISFFTFWPWLSAYTLDA